MENVLLKLKRLLNSIDDEELKELELWIDNENTIDLIVLDTNSITLVTDYEKLKINNKDW